MVRTGRNSGTLERQFKATHATRHETSDQKLRVFPRLKGRTMSRAPGNRGRPCTGAIQPVLKRGPGSCGDIIGDTGDNTPVIPFGRMPL
jgi:hypothetical protein